MNKNLRIFLVLFGLILGLMVYLEYQKNSITNWSKTYQIDSKQPFGLFIFNQEKKDLFKGKIYEADKNFFRYLNDSTIKKKVIPQNFILLAESIDASSLDTIMAQVDKGKNLFISSENFPYALSDYIPVHMDVPYNAGTSLVKLKTSQGVYPLELNRFPSGRFFLRVPKNSEILGTVTNKEGKNNGQELPNFIRVPHGKGYVYLHQAPEVFTNYYLLKKNGKEHAAAVLNFLPEGSTALLTNQHRFESQNILRFILGNSPLRMAWYCVLAGLLLYAVFNVKRRQRIVPVIEPPVNRSLEFVQTIGNLYLQEGDFHDMMNKKATFFLQRLRSEYGLETEKLDLRFQEKLSAKAGISLTVAEKVCEYLTKAKSHEAFVTEEDLIQMNNLLNQHFPHLK